MKYFVDLDNTLCITKNSEYNESEPIVERIEELNRLKEAGHTVVIWTARGSKSGINHTNLTLKQLADWNVKYDTLLMEKPDYDIYIDDKSHNVDLFWPIIEEKSKKEESVIVEKGWGKEIIFVNNDEYCGKILCFEANKKFSMHYHLKKKETWFVSKGSFDLLWINTANGITYKEKLKVGDVITNERGAPHQLIALEDSELFEVSTKHYDDDSFRIVKGN